MRRVWPVAWLSGFILGCGTSGTPDRTLDPDAAGEVADTVLPFDPAGGEPAGHDPRPDAPTGDALPDEDGAVAHSEPLDASGDLDDLQSLEIEIPGGEDTLDASPESLDVTATDGGEWQPCTRATACGPAATCNLSSGLCEARSPGWTPSSLLSVYPAAGAPGDFIVVDGGGFGIFTAVSVGGAAANTQKDENRLIVTRPGTSGPLVVGGKTWNVPLQTSSQFASMQACGFSDPPATGLIPAEPFDAGPHAAGFADYNANLVRLRVFYPARCGGLRKPPSDGVFPFVLFVHGDGYVPLDFEYLARHLATWGYISAIPDYPDATILETGLKGPGTWFAPLAGHQAGGEAVVVCHSKGAEYLHNLGFANVRAVVFLGPVYTIEAPFGGLFPVEGLVLGGSEDGKPTADRCLDVYQQLLSPKYMAMIHRGNHGQFLDDKMWDPPSDGSGMFIARNRQHELVQAFTLAYLQRVLGQGESFGGWLSDPGLPDEVTFWAMP